MIIFASLCITVPAVAMEITGITQRRDEENKKIYIKFHLKKTFEITQKENDDFVQHLSNAVEFNTKMVEEKEIDKNNAVHRILNNLSQDLEFHNNDLAVMLQSTKYAPVLNCLFAYDLNSRKQIKSVSEDQIKITLVRAHQFAAEYYLAEMYSQYKKMSYTAGYLDEHGILPLKVLCVHHFDKWAGGGDFSVEGECVKAEDRVDFMIENADYLNVEDEKEKQARIYKYIANILYQEIFAKHVD